MHSIDLKSSAIYSYKYIITSRVYSNKTTQSLENVKNQIMEEYENSDLGSDSFSAIQDKNIKQFCIIVLFYGPKYRETRKKRDNHIICFDP